MSFAEAASCEQRANAITAEKRPRKEFFTGGCMKSNLSDKFWLVEKFLSGVRSQESGVRSQESGVRSQESGVRSQESGVRSQESGVRSQDILGNALPSQAWYLVFFCKQQGASSYSDSWLLASEFNPSLNSVPLSFCNS